MIQVNLILMQGFDIKLYRLNFMNVIFFAFEIFFTKIDEFFVVLFIGLKENMFEKFLILSEIFYDLLQTFIFETQINMKWHDKRLLVSINFLSERTFKYYFFKF